MARIKRLDFRIDILKLLAGSVEFPEMALSEPHVALEAGKDNPESSLEVAGKGRFKGTVGQSDVAGDFVVDRGRHPRRLKLAPLDFGVAGGNLVSQIELDGRKPRIVTGADITAKGHQKGAIVFRVSSGKTFKRAGYQEAIMHSHEIVSVR